MEDSQMKIREAKEESQIKESAKQQMGNHNVRCTHKREGVRHQRGRRKTSI